MQPDEFTGGPVLAWSANDPAPPGPLPYALIGNPQSLNKYAYTYNNPVHYTDPDGHAVDTIVDIGLAAASVYAAYKEPTAAHIGVAVLDVVLAATPFVPAVVGATVRVANKVDDAADAAKGVNQAADGAQAAKAGSSRATRNPNGKDGNPDHQEKVAKLADKARSETRPGEQMLEGKQVRQLPSKRQPDVQIVGSNGKTRKVFEAERHPNRKRNKKREAEYDSLGLEQETHKVGK